MINISVWRLRAEAGRELELARGLRGRAIDHGYRLGVCVMFAALICNVLA